MLYALSPYNVIRVELTASEQSDAMGIDGLSARHARARAALDRWRADGILRHEDSPAFYLYSQSFKLAGNTRTRTSIVAAVKLAPWTSGTILPHERTLSAPRAERLGLIRATNANLSPIWALFHDGNRSVANAVGAARASIQQRTTAGPDGVEHRLEVVSARDSVEALRRALNATTLFIADGHHRYETALAYSRLQSNSDDAPAHFVMMVLTDADDPALVVLPTHRLVHGLEAEHVAGLTEKLEKSFHVERVPLPQVNGEFPSWLDRALRGDDGAKPRFGLLVGNSGLLLVLEPRATALASLSSGGILATLNVWISQKLLLEAVLGLSESDIEGESHLRYTRDATEARRSVEAGDAQLALMLPSTPVRQLLDVATAGEVMPQKSTYFYPKPATGMVLRMLDEW